MIVCTDSVNDMLSILCRITYAENIYLCIGCIKRVRTNIVIIERYKEAFCHKQSEPCKCKLHNAKQWTN